MDAFFLSVDRPVVIAQTVGQLAFATGAIAVAESVEGRRVSRLCEMGEFMTDYIVAQLGWKEHVEIGKPDASLTRIACAEHRASVGYLPAVDP